MHTCPVRKCGWGGDRRVERNGQIEAIRHKVIERGHLGEIILHRQFRVVKIEMRDQPTERGDTIALSNAHHCDVEAVRARLQRRGNIRDGTSEVIMTMKLDTDMWIAFSAEAPQLFTLARRGNTNRIRQADALHTCLDNRIKNGQQINQVATKGILGGEAHVASSRLDAMDERHGIGDNTINVTAMTEGTQRRRCPVKEIQSENRCIQRGLYISTNTTHMRHDVRAQAEFTQGIRGLSRLRRNNRRGNLYECHADCIQQARYRQSLFKGKKGPGKLLAFAQRRIKNCRDSCGADAGALCLS